MAYWAVIFYFFNERNMKWKDFWGVEVLFMASFIVFILFSIVMLITFIAYCIYNKKKALIIAFSPRYLFENYWNDVNNAFD